MNCDWCGVLVTDPVEQPTRLASNRSPVTSEPVGMDVTFTVVSQDRQAVLHQDCHAKIGATFITAVVDSAKRPPYRGGDITPWSDIQLHGYPHG